MLLSATFNPKEHSIFLKSGFAIAECWNIKKDSNDVFTVKAHNVVVSETRK
jgi:hypothetical protein